MELDRFLLAAGGGKRSALNILESFLISFMLGLRSGWRVGGNFASSGRDQKLLQALQDIT